MVGAITLGLAEEQRAAHRVVFREQPVLGHHGLGQTPGQRQFADDRCEDLLLVEQGEVLRVGQAEVGTNILHRLPSEQYRGHQRQNAGE
ncbi:hypothetical protein D3C81_1004530 [compost metagenome]